MKEIGKAVRTGYYSKLHGAIIVNGSAVPVFDSMADLNTPYPYIILSTNSTGNLDNKNNFTSTFTQVVDIVTGFPSNDGSEQSEIISDQLLNLIVPHDRSQQINVGVGLICLDSLLQSSQGLNAMSGTTYIYRKVLRIKHIIQQLN